VRIVIFSQIIGIVTVLCCYVTYQYLKSLFSASDWVFLTRE